MNNTRLTTYLLRRLDSHQRPLGYEPSELLLLHSACDPVSWGQAANVPMARNRFKQKSFLIATHGFAAAPGHRPGRLLVACLVKRNTRSGSRMRKERMPSATISKNVIRYYMCKVKHLFLNKQTFIPQNLLCFCFLAVLQNFNRVDSSHSSVYDVEKIV